jgi:hypothetical protein
MTTAATIGTHFRDMITSTQVGCDKYLLKWASVLENGTVEL